MKPGQYASKMIALFEETFGQVKKQRIPASADIQDADSSNLVGYQEATQHSDPSLEWVSIWPKSDWI